MENKNFDGIKRPYNILEVKTTFVEKCKVAGVDGIVLQRRALVRIEAPLAYVVPFNPKVKPASGFVFLRKDYFKQKLPIMAVFVLLALAFSGGMWAALNTTKSAAESQPQVLASVTTRPSEKLYRVSLESSAPLGPVSSVPNDVLFHMTISQLENYMANVLKTPEAKEAEILAERKEKLKIYLQEKNSPLADIVNTLAELKHWEMVLAISNSESSLGKRCYNNNCSGIGVEPGHPLWRDYKTKADWAKDLDKLLEKRYKDWTLENMNGVYNKPGSKNWLMASKQILEDLQERGIE